MDKYTYTCIEYAYIYFKKYVLDFSKCSVLHSSELMEISSSKSSHTWTEERTGTLSRNESTNPPGGILTSPRLQSTVNNWVTSLLSSSPVGLGFGLPA